MEDADLEGFSLESSSNLDVTRKKEGKKNGGFQSFGLSLPVLKGVYKKGYRVPTPIQRKTIPLILQGRDVVGMARTGSGKTACFLLPLFEKLIKKAQKSHFSTRALIFSPTRELALQTLKFVKELGKFTSLKAVAILGGDSMDYQFGAVHNNPDIIVATPGRFLHLCVEMNLKLHCIEYVVFDEADRLFEMGLGEQLKEILDRLGDSRQTVLFSATLPKMLLDFANAGLNNPILLRLDVESKLPQTLELAFILAKQDEKLASLLCLLQSLPENSQTLVFVATKHHVEYLHMILDKANISNTYLYSDLDPSARKINAAKFQIKKCSVLIVTDVAARGVDIPHLDFVINYHFPSKSKLFVHRVGRCARAGKTGTAFSLVCMDEMPYMLDLHLFLGRNLNLIKGGRVEEKINYENAVGKIPTSLVENQQSELAMWHQNFVEISSMHQVCLNAYKKYLSSRPAISRECVKKIKETDFTQIGIHPFFKNFNDETKSVDFLQEVKNYKPKGTIFELNLSDKSKCYSVMKITKKKHEQHILNFKNRLEKIKNVFADSDNIIKKEIKDENFRETDTENVLSKASKRKNKCNQIFEIKKCKFIDENFYVPHQASDEHTERGFAISNFGNEANKASFDLIADCDEGMKIRNQMKKWDKKKKKIVNVEHQKAGKFKTESGNWISHSYQSNRYEKWKERCKEAYSDVSDENEETLEKHSNRKYLRKGNDFPNTKWGRRDRKAAEKLKAKAKLKRPEQILKNRLELEHKQRKSLPRILKKQWRKKKKNK